MQQEGRGGLDGVVAAETGLSHVDGQAGRLIVRGHEVQELASGFGFEATAALLWRGLAPGDAEGGAVRAALGAARLVAWRLLPALLPAAAGLTPVAGLRVGLSMLAGEATPPHLLATAAMPVFVAALARARAGTAAVPPDPTAGQVGDFLRMLGGRAAEPALVRGLEGYLVTVADHGMNASTFTARVVASTRAGMIASVVAALSALEGPLHGGAPGPVLDMLDEIGTADRAEAWMTGSLDLGDRLMGFGHRVYRTRDPRADVLKGLVAELRGRRDNRIAFAEAVERAALAALARRHPDRRLDTNVEFYTALLLEAVGLPRDLFTCAFAMGRVLGWTAHVFEQERVGRLIRPASRYVGPMPVAGRAA